jgi:methionyl-tRNA formyltransferase
MPINLFVVTDNRLWFEKLHRSSTLSIQKINIDLYCSPKGAHLFKSELSAGSIAVVDLNKVKRNWVLKYDLGISAHCKQIFPVELLRDVRCFNIHPGFNPYNRGWFPQVFSIINKQPIGVTIHEMDEKIDHGEIVIQKKLTIDEDYTSKDVYDRLIELEFECFEEVIDSLTDNTYKSFPPADEGNYNSISDYRSLCEIDLDKSITMREAIDYLRAMTHPPYHNAYFLDSNDQKVYVEISFSKKHT